MKQLKKFFETQKGCDEFEFRSTAGLIPLSAVAILCYAGLTIGLYIWGKYAIAWQNIVSVCFLFLMMIGVLSMMYIMYRRIKHNMTFTRKNINLIRNIGAGLNICMIAIFMCSFSHILREPLLFGMYILIGLLEFLVDLTASILVKGEAIQEEQNLTI